MLAVFLCLLGLSTWVYSISVTDSCSEFVLPINVSLQTTILDILPPRNQTELTGFVTQLASQPSNLTAGGLTDLHASYDIFSQLCVPPGFQPGGVVEFAIHGINFDHTYWSFGGPGSKYNYAEAALRNGHAIFTYDRLGVGRSSKPDGIKEVQLSTEVEVAAVLVKYLRAGFHGRRFGNIIGVGHSFGSLQFIGLASKYDNLVDATILTGFSPYSGGTSTAVAAFGLTIASEQDHDRFGSLSTSYLATGGIYNDQMNFFHYPEFDFASLQLASKTKGTLTLGELLTQSAEPALNYTKPVFVVTGDKDFIFCGGNCYQQLDGANNLIQPTKSLFPASSDFSIYIPPMTGHAINVHFSAPETFNVMQKWIAGL